MNSDDRVLPAKMAPDVLLPRYVKLSNVIAQPMFIRDWVGFEAVLAR